MLTNLTLGEVFQDCIHVRYYRDSCSLLCVPSSSLTAKQLSEAVELELFDSGTALELLFAKVFWLRKKSFSLIICEIELQPKITAACIITSKIYRETFKDHIWNLYFTCRVKRTLFADEPFRLNRPPHGRIWTVDDDIFSWVDYVDRGQDTYVFISWTDSSY